MSKIKYDLNEMTSALAQQDSRNTVANNMTFIADHIDDYFGKGFAKANPSLVAELTKAISIEMNTVVNASIKVQLHDD